MSRMTWAGRTVWTPAVIVGILCLSDGSAPPARAGEVHLASGFRIEVVATGVPRPAQLAFTASGRLAVLSHGWRGDAAAEIFWLDPLAAMPIDASRAPRVVIPFAEGPRKTVLGSLAVDPKSGDLFLGEENGNRIYRLTGVGRLTSIAVGLNHLVGPSVRLERRLNAGLLFGHLVVVRHAVKEVDHLLQLQIGHIYHLNDASETLLIN